MAPYADKLLADGERVVLRTRQHWLALIVNGRMALAILVASIVLLILNVQLSRSTIRDLVGYLAVVLLVASLLWLLRIYLSWWAEDYAVTNRRVLKIDGIVRKHSADSALEKINDAVLDQGIFGRMFGYGDLEILTAADQTVDHYHMLNGAPGFKKAMLDEKFRLEQEAFQVTSPPLRAGPFAPPPSTEPTAPPSAQPGPAPVSAPAPPAPSPTVDQATPVGAEPPPEGGAMVAGSPARTADEITRALSNLAELRDRGAISPEDYEAKKTELLGRL